MGRKLAREPYGFAVMQNISEIRQVTSM